jgi:hypothetical protein
VVRNFLPHKKTVKRRIYNGQTRMCCPFLYTEAPKSFQGFLFRARYPILQDGAVEIMRESISKFLRRRA